MPNPTILLKAKRCALTVTLLATVVLATPTASRADGATGRTILGGSLTAAGIAMVPVTTEYSLSPGDVGTAALAGTIPTLLIPGIPTMVLGVTQIARGNSAVTNPANLAVYQRYEAGKALFFPFLFTGSLVGGISLSVTVVNEVNMWYSGAPGYILPAVAFAVFGTGMYFAIDGDNALVEVYGLEDTEDDTPGQIILGGGITLMAVGTGLLAAMTPVVRMEALGSGEEVVPVLTATLTGVGFMTGGIVMLATGAARMAAAQPSAAPTARRSMVRIDGFVPIHDPHTETTGLGIVGRF